MSNEKKIFESYSYLSIIRYIVYQLLCVVLLVYLGISFNENPTLILVLIIFLVFILLMNSRGSIIVYNDRVLIVYKRIVKQMSTIREYKFNEITSITADLPLTETSHIVTELLPPMFSFISIWNTITIKFKNGSTIQLKSKIYREQYFRAFAAIKSQYPIDITVIDMRK